MNDRKDVVVVEDNIHVRDSIQHLLEYAGFACRMFDCAESFLATEVGEPCLCLFDFRLPGLSGLDLLEFIRKEGHDFPVILMSGNFDSVTNEKVADLGVVTCLQKPFRPDDFFQTVERLTQQATRSQTGQ